MSSPYRLLAVLALATTACASGPAGRPLTMRPAEPVADPVPDFVDQGRIQFTPAGTPGSSAAWDARSVRGPAVNMTLTDEGLWGGTIRNRPVLLRAGGGRITGEGVNLYVTQEGPFVHVQGMWFNNMLRIDVSQTTLSASPTAGVCGIELALAEDGYWRGFGGCGGRINYTWMTLHGVAGNPSAEMPQWLFAFLGALPSPQTTVFGGGALAGVDVGVGVGGPTNWFLPAEFRGPAPWPGPRACQAYGPFGCQLSPAGPYALDLSPGPRRFQQAGAPGRAQPIGAVRPGGAGRAGNGGVAVPRAPGARAVAAPGGGQAAEARTARAAADR